MSEGIESAGLFTAFLDRFSGLGGVDLDLPERHETAPAADFTGVIVERDRRVYVRVRGKGDRERDVPVMPQLGRGRRRHVERGTTSDRVFLGLRRGRSGDHEPLTRSGIDQLIRLLGEEAGLEKRPPPLAPDSFATWALTRGMNPVQLAQIVGHSSLAMIQSVYVHVTPQDAYLALEQIVRADE